MRIELPYGASTVSAEVDWIASVDWLTVGDASPAGSPVALLQRALANPIGQSESLLERVRPGETVTFVVSDSFRVTGIDRLLPHLLERLIAKGIRQEDISFLVATGVHRGPTDAELDAILGAAVHAAYRDRVVIHDAEDASACELVGTTSRGTPVEVNRAALACDRLIVTGAVVLHYFGGFGGGRKALLPGLCSARTIAANHSLNLSEDGLDPRVRIGVTDGNPVAEDMLEGARLIGADCIINTVLNRDGAIAAVFAGDLEAAHAEACAFARRMYCVPLGAPADLVIAASPHTQNFVQTHKALYNAHRAMKPGGVIVLLAPCPEGLGGERFEQWLRLGSPEAIIAALRERSEINGQTALSTVEKARHCIMVTELSAEAVAQLGATQADGLAEALEMARERLAAAGIEAPSAVVMPDAAYSVPDRADAAVGAS